MLKLRTLNESMKLSVTELTLTFDLYIVGVQKCGTTSVYEMLARSNGCVTHPAMKDLPIFTLENMPPKALAIQQEIEQVCVITRGVVVVQGPATKIGA